MKVKSESEVAQSCPTLDPMDSSLPGSSVHGIFQARVPEWVAIAFSASPITSWQIDGEKVTDIILGGSKITADGDCSHEIKRRLLLGRKVMTNLDSILKSGDITLPKKVCLVKATVFPVVIYGCESWTIKKAECQRIDAFELWLEKTLESSLDSKEIQPVHPKGDQSWVFIGRTDAEAETPDALATSCEELTHWKRP